MRFLLTGALVAGVLATATPVWAQSVAVGFGTQGANTQIGIDIGDMGGLRLEGNYFSFSRGVSGSDVDYDGELRLLSIGLLADLYMFDTGFHLTGGGYFNGNRVNFTATPTSNIRIGGTTYTPAQAGTLDGRATYSDFAPYAGVGYAGNRRGQGLSFLFDAGVMFQRGANVVMRSTGPLAANAVFAADLERERREIKDDIDDFRFYPVVKVGLAYRF